ncbi:MAG: phosphoglycolate phosphatase [Acidilobaceae archaeon]
MERDRGSLRVAVLDVDGTLTVRRGSLLLSPEAVVAVRVLKCMGMIVSLVSGNSLPIVAGLSAYLGADIAIGENGCIALLEGEEEVHICKSRPPRWLVEEVLKLGFRESWQNKFRVYDLAFYPPPGDLTGGLRRARKLALENGFAASWSGYALHIHPREGGKDRGVEAILEKLGLEWSNVLAVGDGDNDAVVLAKARMSIALADASELAKRASTVIARSTGGSGVLEALLELAGFESYSEALSRCGSL